MGFLDEAESWSVMRGPHYFASLPKTIESRVCLTFKHVDSMFESADDVVVVKDRTPHGVQSQIGNLGTIELRQ
jgi:hypothetical protein